MGIQFYLGGSAIATMAVAMADGATMATLFFGCALMFCGLVGMVQRWD